MIKKNTVFALSVASLLSCFASNAVASTKTYELDPYHTNVTWHADHFGFSSPSGKFTKVLGELKLDVTNPQNASLNVTINTNGIVTGIEKFDEHLKSADFFNVSSFTTAKFISKKVKIVDKENAIVYGTLELLGVKKNCDLKVKLNKIGQNPFSKKDTIGFSAETVIKRSEFGMSYGIPGVSDDVKITIESEVIAK
jgi:polyisoprenoid-binding protein YceI